MENKMKSFIVLKDGKYLRVKATKATGDWAELVVGEADVSEADEDYIIGYVDGEAIIDNTKRETEQAENALKKSIGDLYDTLNIEVLADMATTFVTSNPDSAITNYIMFMDMKSFPLEYVDKGIKVTSTVLNADGSTLFGPGDLLNTEEKVLSFSSRTLQLAREYGIRRLQKIDKFIDDKNAILGV